MKPQKLESFYSKQYEPLALRNRSPNTLRLYRMTIRHFSLFLGRNAMVHDLRDSTVSNFATHRLQQGKAKKTVNRDLCCLLAIWRWAHRKGYLKNWPDVAKEKVPVRTPRAFTRAELASIFRAIQAESQQVGTFDGPDFWNALFLVCWDTGERIGAVMRLEWHRVDLVSGWVNFRAETRKGGMADNALPLAQDTVEALKKISRPDGKVFCWPYCDSYIFRRVAKIMTRAGLPDSREFKFHAIRKSTASHYEAAGGNATELLGHSSRKVTENYLDPRICRPIPAVELLFRPGA